MYIKGFILIYFIAYTFDMYFVGLYFLLQIVFIMSDRLTQLQDAVNQVSAYLRCKMFCVFEKYLLFVQCYINHLTADDVYIRKFIYATHDLFLSFITYIYATRDLFLSLYCIVLFIFCSFSFFKNFQFYAIFLKKKTLLAGHQNAFKNPLSSG